MSYTSSTHGQVEVANCHVDEVLSAQERSIHHRIFVYMSWTIAPTPISELLLTSSPRLGLAEHIRASLGICKVGLMFTGKPAALGARQMEDELVEKVPMRDDSEHLFRPLEHKIGRVERTLT